MEDYCICWDLMHSKEDCMQINTQQFIDEIVAEHSTKPTPQSHSYKCLISDKLARLFTRIAVSYYFYVNFRS